MGGVGETTSLAVVVRQGAGCALPRVGVPLGAEDPLGSAWPFKAREEVFWGPGSPEPIGQTSWENRSRFASERTVASLKFPSS